MAHQYVYLFGGGRAEGGAGMREVLGGKGANLAEMAGLGIPVPAGFTITTEVCTYYYRHGKTYPEALEGQVQKALAHIETAMGTRFGDAAQPLLVSIRSGARISMPGMMETVLNVGLTEKTVAGLIARTGNARFAYDAYRRLIMMYADVVMEKAAGVEPPEGKGIRHQLEEIMAEVKRRRGIAQDTDLTAEDLETLVVRFKERVLAVLGRPFPDDAREQLWGGISAVFQSWQGKRAIQYRRIEGIPEEWGTAVNVQSMVFGNMGENSATGVAFTRNPATGENTFYGEWLANAQGEDVVAGIRTPSPLTRRMREIHGSDLVSLEEAMPEQFRELEGIRHALEKHFREMQDIEFTIQDGRLWMLQTRTGKRNGGAAVRVAVDMVHEGLIDEAAALLRVRPTQLNELLHPMLDPAVEDRSAPIGRGLPAGPGGASGQIVFTADDASAWVRQGKTVILVRNETSPEDVQGMHVAEAILTAKGGMTSHAALVARGWGKCCIVGCAALEVHLENREARLGGRALKEGDWISLNGTSGLVYGGRIPSVKPDLTANPAYVEFMAWADKHRRLGIRTNADRPQDASQARAFGAEGIGLVRTEHMFFGPERIMAMREMILAGNEADRRKAVMKLLPFQREDFVGIFEAMAGLPVTIRLLDPPLHEFVNIDDGQIGELAKTVGASYEAVRARRDALHELNPMLGHRGCRLGITYPEITEMQARAIFEAAAILVERGETVHPEVMVPLVGIAAEFRNQEAIIRRVAGEVMAEKGVRLAYTVGTMIEIPRACLTADDIAAQAEFFSFGTNDLTQTTFGFSRDDVGEFLPRYLSGQILATDPFESIDEEGVGQLIRMAIGKGRAVRPDLKVGICGEQGGDPPSIDFCHRVGVDYVSCSPFRVPVARLAAAQAALRDRK